MRDGKERGSTTIRPARITYKEDLVMKKTSKRAISLLLTLTLMFSAVMMFPSSVSAEYPKAFTLTYADGTFSGSITISTKTATARTGYSSTTGLTVNSTIYYNYYSNATGKLLESYNMSTNSNASTSVSTAAVALPPNGGIFSKSNCARGEHTGKGHTQKTYISA